MTVSIAFALIGGVILIGFFANLLFRLTKIPSVLLLIAIGVALGPITGWVTSSSLITIAPFFGTMALLIILFQGGLELDIESVVKEAPRAAFLALMAFILSFISIAIFAFFVLHMSLLNALLIAGILGANSPAICIPIISGLTVRKEIKAILKLESALGDVLLIVTVLLILDFQTTGRQSAFGMLFSFILSFAVAFLISSVAGALWSRLIGWMGKEPLAYMLTLGIVFLLYFAVEELHGSAALAVLMFGMMLENMRVVADHVGRRVRRFFGIDIRADQFALHEFMKNITDELSFLVRTFFFVYLGLLLDFSRINLYLALSGVGVVALLVVSRWVTIRSINRGKSLTEAESRVVLAMLPRGLATAVMAFLPAQYGISGTDLLPIYAFMAIVLTNVLMTGGIVLGEKHLARERITEMYPSDIVQEFSKPAVLATLSPHATMPDAEASFPTPSPPIVEDWEKKESQPITFHDWMSRLFGIHPEEREGRYVEAISASMLSEPTFWVQIFLASVLTALGLVLNQSAIIIGAALIMPIALPVLAAGLALAVGDIYLLLKLLLKLILLAVMVAVLSVIFSDLLPFNAVTAEIASRTKPTILDFLVAFFAGMAGAVLLFSKNKILHYFPGAILAVTLLPPLVVLGFGIGSEFSTAIFRGAALLFTANFFAAILGASIVYSAVRMSETANLTNVRNWKQRELSRPFVKFLFNNLKLRGIVGRAGSIRSRLVVVAIFLLALVIPLQMAFNQLGLEFRARQAVTDVEKMFDVSGRSAIINSTSNIGENEISVRIQVATNAFFASEDIERFEERVSDRTGKPTTLSLVQSLSDIGEGNKVRGMLAQATPPPVEHRPGINELALGLRDEIEKSLRTASLPQSIAILRANAEFGMSQSVPAFRIDYLAEAPLSEDARTLLANVLERQMGLNSRSLYLMHIPEKWDIRLNHRAELLENGSVQLREIQNRLAQYPLLHAQVEITAQISEKQSDQLRTTLYELAPSLADPARATIASNPGKIRGLTITFRPTSKNP